MARHYQVIFKKIVTTTAIVSFEVSDGQNSNHVNDFIRDNVVPDRAIGAYQTEKPVTEYSTGSACFTSDSFPDSYYSICAGDDCDGLCDNILCDNRPAIDFEDDNG